MPCPKGCGADCGMLFSGTGCGTLLFSFSSLLSSCLVDFPQFKGRLHLHPGLCPVPRPVDLILGCVLFPGCKGSRSLAWEQDTTQDVKGVDPLAWEQDTTQDVKGDDVATIVEVQK